MCQRSTSMGYVIVLKNKSCYKETHIIWTFRTLIWTVHLCFDETGSESPSTWNPASDVTTSHVTSHIINIWDYAADAETAGLCCFRRTKRIASETSTWRPKLAFCLLLIACGLHCKGDWRLHWQATSSRFVRLSAIGHDRMSAAGGDNFTISLPACSVHDKLWRTIDFWQVETFCC